MERSLTQSTAALAAACLGAALVAGSAQAAGSITGKATFEGKAPKRRVIMMEADPECAKINPDGRPGEVMLVSDSGGLQNIFVYISDGLGDATFEKPSEPAVFDQENCMFTPRVMGVHVGQTIEIRNSDPTLHNVHSLPKKSRQFNNAMPLQNQVIKKRFTSAEIMVRIKCDVHAWMGAYIGVLKHPFFAVSDAEGAFEIKDVPSGTYTVVAWHERLGTREGQVTVATDGSASIDFSFPPAAPAAGN